MSEPRCIAYQEDGQMCGEPATVIDPQRGGMVCTAHAPPGGPHVPPHLSTQYSEGRLWEKLILVANSEMHAMAPCPQRLSVRGTGSVENLRLKSNVGIRTASDRDAP
jgi:hypothetical protein